MVSTFRRGHLLVGAVMVTLGLGSVARVDAANAIYSVQLVGSSPARLLVKIDTRPWPELRKSPTANLDVVLTQPDGSTVRRKLDFLSGLDSPKSLKAGEIYQRTLQVNGVTAIALSASSMTFPNEQGKADDAASPRTVSAAPTSKIGEPVIVPPPASAVMSLEPNTNRDGQDLFANPMSTASAQECSSRCLGNKQCRAFTFVKAAGAGGACWLKFGVPATSGCPNCTSGVKRP